MAVEVSVGVPDIDRTDQEFVRSPMRRTTALRTTSAKITEQAVVADEAEEAAVRSEGLG